MSEPCVNLRTAAEVLQRIAPDLVPVGVAEVHGGTISKVYEVTCADGDEPLILKVYGEQDGWRLRKEISVYRILREHGVSTVPRMLGAAPGENSPLGRPYLVMTRLAGVTVGQAASDLSAGETAECYRQMGRILAQVHAIGQESFGFLVDGIIDAQPTNLAYTTTLFEARSETYLALSGDRETHAAAHRYVAERSDLLTLCEKPVLVHNDFHEGNVLVARGPDGPVVTGVIDVENAMAGDPLVDFAKTSSYSIRGDRGKLDAFFAGYGSVPEEWEARQRLYQLVHYFELWVWSHEVGDSRFLDSFVADVQAIIAAG